MVGHWVERSAMFKDNKYTKHYNLLIEKAKNRTLPKETYTETHHIIPRSLGGNDDKANLVVFTAREHFISHWLLVKMLDGAERNKMVTALMFFRAKNRFSKRYQSYITGRVYELYRIEHANNISTRMKGNIPWNKDKIGVQLGSRLGKTHSEEARAKMSATRKGRPALNKGKSPSQETLEILKNLIFVNKDGKMKRVNRHTVDEWLFEGWSLGKGKPPHNKGKLHSEESRAKMSATRKGKPLTEKQMQGRKGKVWIHKGDDRLCVKKDEVDAFILLGWMRGSGLIPWNKKVKIS
jgi:hypothetical protein